MLPSLSLHLASALAGLIVGGLIVYLGPRLAAHRVPDPGPLPGGNALVPIVVPYATRCRSRASIGVQCGAALAFLALSVRFGAGSKLLLGALFSSILIAIAYIDLDYLLVLDRVSYSGLGVALALSPFWPGLGLERACGGAIAGLVIFVILGFLGIGMLGAGDRKLAALIGAMHGFPNVLDALLLGILLGGLAALVALAILGRPRNEAVAFAPYLAAGAILSFLVTLP